MTEKTKKGNEFNFGIKVINHHDLKELSFIGLIGKKNFNKLSSENFGVCTCCAGLQKVEYKDNEVDDILGVINAELDQCKKCGENSIEDLTDLLGSGVIQIDYSKPNLDLNVFPRKDFKNWKKLNEEEKALYNELIQNVA